jgi:RNA recognition motif-containing protein
VEGVVALLDTTVKQTNTTVNNIKKQGVMAKSTAHPNGFCALQGIDVLGLPEWRPEFERAPLGSCLDPAAGGVREPTPPPIDRLKGFLEGPPTGLREQGELVPGPGACPSVVPGMGLTRLGEKQALLVRRAKKYAVELSIKMVLLKQALAQQTQQTRLLERQQAVALMSRIYVGGIDYETTDEQIRRAFQAFGPVKKVDTVIDLMSGHHKGFAHIDFEQPEAAHIVMTHSTHLVVMGKKVKVCWPSQMPGAQAMLDRIRKEALKSHRIYVAGIHKNLTCEEIEGVFAAYGTIKSCELASDGEGSKQHRGYGYIEYETRESKQEAISSMNQFDLGGHLLRVYRAVTPPGYTNQLAVVPSKPMPRGVTVAAAVATAEITAMNAVASNLGVTEQMKDVKIKSPWIGKILLGSLRDRPSRKRSRSRSQSPIRTKKRETQPAYYREEPRPPPAALPPAEAAKPEKGVKGKVDIGPIESDGSLQQEQEMMIKGKTSRAMVTEKMMNSRGMVPSVVLLLKNMVGPEEVIDEEFQDEIEEELGKFGKVENIVVYQERSDDTADAEVSIKVFVEFTDTMEAHKAKAALNGRFFGGRSLAASLYDQHMYEKQDLSG